MGKKSLVVILSVLFVLSCSLCGPAIGAEEGVYPDGPTCEQLTSAKWQDTTLYDLTYGCLPAGWDTFFKQDDVRAQVKNISTTINNQVKKGYKIGPDISRTFRAFYSVAPDTIKAVIMGQDPAPQPGLATGLSFSTEPNVSSSKVASIQRVLLEVQNEGKCVDLGNGDIKKWADEGVVLLNMALTIPCPSGSTSCTRAGHVPLWRNFTMFLVRYIDTHANPSVFILWGSAAGQYGKYVTYSGHKVLKGGHPSPLSDSKKFFCKNYFGCANDWLTKKERDPVDWNLKDSCGPSQPCIWSKSKTPSCVISCTLSACN
jgi:uracil-DNA glycosylase